MGTRHGEQPRNHFEGRGAGGLRRAAGERRAACLLLRGRGRIPKAKPFFHGATQAADKRTISRGPRQALRGSNFRWLRFAGDIGLQLVLTTCSGDASLWYKVSVALGARALRFECAGHRGSPHAGSTPARVTNPCHVHSPPFHHTRRQRARKRPLQFSICYNRRWSSTPCPREFKPPWKT
jgi:hypothetical protein